jgi:glycosyltransferase involved in cell wall biosynthesis
MTAFEENETSKNANGGTEIIKRKLAKLIDPELTKNFQIIPSRIRDLQEDKIRILWSHDLPEDPESSKVSDPDFRNKFHKLVFVSNWQYSRYQLVCGVPYDQRSIVIENGINPAPMACLNKPEGTIRIAYTSTPQRGLEVLVPVFKHLAQSHPNIHLDVFSSFKIYGQEDRDKYFEPLYQECREHPQITYHGFTPNEQLKGYLNRSHIFAYPNIWLETGCIALMEAMSAGLVCVHPNFGALPETSGGLNLMYQGNFSDKLVHARIFLSYLELAIKLVEQKQHINAITYNKMYADNRFNINNIKNQWEALLSALKADYPTADSRAFVK